MTGTGDRTSPADGAAPIPPLGYRVTVWQTDSVKATITVELPGRPERQHWAVTVGAMAGLQTDQADSARQRLDALAAMLAATVFISAPVGTIPDELVTSNIVRNLRQRQPGARVVLLSVGWADDRIAPFTTWGEVRNGRHLPAIEWPGGHPFRQRDAKHYSADTGLAYTHVDGGELSPVVSKAEHHVVDMVRALPGPCIEYRRPGALIDRHWTGRYDIRREPSDADPSGRPPTATIWPGLLDQPSAVTDGVHETGPRWARLTPFNLTRFVDPPPFHRALAARHIVLDPCPG